jgi:hypothetical protein
MLALLVKANPKRHGEKLDLILANQMVMNERMDSFQPDLQEMQSCYDSMEDGTYRYNLLKEEQIKLKEDTLAWYLQF